MAKNIENKTSYTDDMFVLQHDIRRYTKFIATMVRLELVTLRTAQVLTSNYSQTRFELLREGIRDGSILK